MWNFRGGATGSVRGGSGSFQKGAGCVRGQKLGGNTRFYVEIVAISREKRDFP